MSKDYIIDGIDYTIEKDMTTSFYHAMYIARYKDIWIGSSHSYEGARDIIINDRYKR